MILETIVTTVAEDGTVNCAPMGVECNDGAIVLKPFLETATYRNVLATGAAVVNLTDDVRVFARAAISNPEYATEPAVAVRGVVLADCCSWRELRVRSIDSTPPRSRVETTVVHHGTRREFIGFNRARHAVIEAAIYATRLHLLPRPFVESEMARLQVIVDKTAGAHELEAMALLAEHIRTRMTVEAVYVESAARLHFGVLDLRGARGRWFGGIGASAPGPTLLVSASPADALEVEGDCADRAAEAARGFLDHHGVRGGARVRVHRALPSHSGLGSGTQLALAVARALAEIHGIATDAAGLARATGRAQRSAIGTWTFAGGGFVLEGGRRADSADVAPLLARLPFPATWRAVVAVPHAARGISGGAEAAAFARLPPPAERDVERIAHLVLMALLPALVEGDLAAFGAALSAVQETTGQWFAPVQGGTFAPGPSQDLVRQMAEWGAHGVGQSSWGPAVYGIVDGDAAGLTLAERVRAALGAAGTVYHGPFRAEGASVRRGDSDSPSFLRRTTV